MHPPDYSIHIHGPQSIYVRLPRGIEFRHSIDECLASGAAPESIPRLWMQPWLQGGSMRIEVPRLDIQVLHQPYLFAGHITERSGSRHRVGQLLINSALEISEYSYHIMDGRMTLPFDLVDGHDKFIGEIIDPVHVGGDHFFLGTAHLHFGRFVLEGLTRVWALQSLQNISNICNFYFYETILASFVRPLYDIAGIDCGKFLGAPPILCPERLFVPSCSMRSHKWISPQQAAVWDRMAEEVNRRVRYVTGARRLYLSRSRVSGRRLMNEAGVEAVLSLSGLR